MECLVTQDKNEHIVMLSGQFTFADNQKFQRVLQLAQERGGEPIVLDFSAVDFIDSAGLGMLLLLRDHCLKKSVPLSIRSAKGQVEKVFTIARFDQLFTLCA